jgi:hypothetical protein
MLLLMHVMCWCMLQRNGALERDEAKHVAAPGAGHAPLPLLLLLLLLLLPPIMLPASMLHLHEHIPPPNF